ncbi:c-type cytochrome [Bradyrhizobium diversitatis]|uniref:Cytochrome c n=1 Tax=Bradyrhizobium diversitatis TaxID=2755406 RepID=A0ABS0NVW8_9BRAD|nr:cytochrome c [Bradyrhizobium diversitatis]MBH5385035.1 cytochrome c [Bradyrhizobium diversitatis]
MLDFACSAVGNGRILRSWLVFLVSMVLLLVPVASTQTRAERGQPAEPVLAIGRGATEDRFTANQLLSRPDAVVLSVTGDVYHHAVAYRAVPLLALLGNSVAPNFDTVEAEARDGFVSEIPFALIRQGASGGSVAYIAVEDIAHPWPPLPQKTQTAGPFYLVWQNPEKSAIGGEQWPYQLTRLSFAESPVHRWAQLAVPADTAVDAPARHGQEVFITQCLPCHRLNGGGASDTGPDLERPMNPTQYLTEAGLRAIIRNPRAVRAWPAQQMVGFSKDQLSDVDLDALVAYLRTMAIASAGCSNNPNDLSCGRK